MSSHAYIDRLYADLQKEQTNNHSLSDEMKADFDRREMKWMELERDYSQRIKDLESQVARAGNSKHKVSMEAYMSGKHRIRLQVS